MKLIVIGRNPQEANLVFNSDYVSGYHAELILLDNGDMYLVDKSTNGTTLNGVRMTPGKEYQVRRGDNVIFADSPLDWSKVPALTIPSNVKKIITVGSHYSSNIKVSGANVSRFHATVRQLTDGKWEICDHSKNGTTLNGTVIPKDRYVRLKSRDHISCAGVPVSNPIPSGSGALKITGIVAACLVALAAIAFGLYKFLDKTYTPETINKMYESSVVLMLGTYHFEVQCGTLDIAALPDPDRFHKSLYSSFVVETDPEDGQSYILPYDGENGSVYMATGFFIGTDGYLATNRHVAKPWESETVSNESSITIRDLAEDYFKAKLTKLYEMGYSDALPYISQVKVEGVLDNVFVIKNGDYYEDSNAARCAEVACGPTLEEDIAIFKSKTGLPANAAYVPMERIAKQKVEPLQTVVTIGFPYGLGLQKDWKNNPIYANVVNGSISKSIDKFAFCFNAPSYQGASGSPVFDLHGNLVGIVHAKMQESGFVFAVKSEHLSKLIQTAGITQQ
jgi:pSer/pThr/pTyr-binding forkhead associated (FHA) protein/S1-C subfamily serine protease